MENNIIIKEKSKEILSDLFQLDSVSEVWAVFENYLVKLFGIIELELFFLDRMTGSKIIGRSSSVNLLDVYKELEEGGLLDWAAKDNEIKIIADTSDVEQIKSLIIIPIVIFTKIYGFFIANTTLKTNALSNINLSEVLSVSQDVFSIVNIIYNEQQLKLASEEQKLLKEQVLLASEQIVKSEVISIITDNFELYLKNMKTNYNLIQNGIGNPNKWQSIINENFNQLQRMQQLIKNISGTYKYKITEINLLDVINLAIDIATPLLNKNGVQITTNFEVKNILTIRMYYLQFLFSFLTILINASKTIEDSGTISIGIYENKENNKNKVTIIISVNNGINDSIVNGDIFLSQTFSETKQNSIFKMYLAQQIIIKHNGRLTIYSDKHKGITYKLIL